MAVIVRSGPSPIAPGRSRLTNDRPLPVSGENFFAGTAVQHKGQKIDGGQRFKSGGTRQSKSVCMNPGTHEHR